MICKWRTVAAVLLFYVQCVNAQVIDQKYENKIEAARSIAALSDGMFGENINEYSGASVFTQVDVSLPGNSDLPVALGRTYSVEDKYGSNNLGGFGDWDVDVPHISGIFGTNLGWSVANSASPDRYRRCSLALPPELGTSSFTVDEVWGGHLLHIPGGDNGQLIAARADSYPDPADGQVYPWTTQSQSRLRCLGSTKNGYPGEAFALVTAGGVTYYFDWAVEVGIRGIGKDSSKTIGRKRIYLLASRVEDRFGNWVNYTYSGSRLTSITANDGRQITLGYSGANVTSVVASSGTWSYQYDSNGNLAAVVLPDTSMWHFAFLGNLKTPPPPSLPPLDDTEPTCAEAERPENTYEYRITHPSGALGKFNFQQKRFYRSRVPWLCNNTPPPGSYDWLTIQNYFDTYALLSVQVSGAGISNQVTSYDYGWSNPLGFCNRFPGSGCQDVCLAQHGCTTADGRWVTTTRPDGSKVKRLMGVQYGINESRMLREQILDQQGIVVRDTSYTYVTDAESASMPFSPTVGQRLVRDPMVGQVRPLRLKVTTQESTNFTYQVDASCGGTYCFDAWARPTRESRFSSSHSRIDTKEYYDHLGEWVLGQVKRTVNVSTGLVPGEIVFDTATGLPLRTYAFGNLKAELTYYADGTVATVADGNNQVTALSNWKRGVPQTIQYPGTPEAPNGAVRSAVVNDNGWITAITDENGFNTGYGYDAMGRLASIVYPTGDSTNWDTTTRHFEQISEDEYGLPAGHWRQTEITDDYRKLVYFDALWRPVVEQEEDLTNDVATLRWRNTRYDHNGRVTFASYPRNPYVDGWTDYTGASWDGGSLPTPLAGLHTTYDALGRVTEAKQDSELGQLPTITRYLSGFLTEITNPRNQTTITGYMAYDQPTHDWPVSISHPEGAYTDIVRDVFGKPKTLTRRNANSSQQVQRHFVYDSRQRLCKSIEPETGTTLYKYDGVGNVLRTDFGMPAFSPSPCDESATTAAADSTMVAMSGPPTGGSNPPQMARYALRTYDARNRLKTLTFLDHNGDQAWEYTPDGLPQRIVTLNSEGRDTVINEYFYNKRRLLTRETLSQPGWYTWPADYDYNGKGHLSGQGYPNGLYVYYDVNALGQPRQASSFATGVQYYPNGAIKQFTYGNGIVHAMTQNARQLPSRSVDGGGVLNHEYVYDANANTQYIYDHVNPALHRYMNYDGLDRLISAGSQVFGGDHWHRFTYNVLDNLTSWKLAGVKDYASYYYDPETNRLTNILNSAGASVVGLSYDRQGNLANRNGQNYLFDHGNRLREVSEREGYHYDGHGRRIMSWRPDGGLNFSLYGQSGQLWYHEYDAKSLAIENVYLAGSLIASREYDWSAGTFATKYHHTDALGSPVAVTNAAGQVTERTDWEPYGAAIGKPNYEGIGFTGHMQDAATGLTYMQQRYYDPMIGRFLSVDPVTAYKDPVGMFNRYKYAANNPYRFIDPDGRQEACTGSRVSCPSATQGAPQNELGFMSSTVPRAPEIHEELNRSMVAPQNGLFSKLTSGGNILDVEAFADDVIPPLLNSPEGAGFHAASAIVVPLSNAIRMHHAWPMYLGGPVKQNLVPLAKEMHDAFHSGLDKVLPRQWGSAYYQSLGPAARQQMLQDLGAYVRAFDAKHQTELYKAMVDNGFPVP